jgi:hypothetical protein
VGSLAKGLSNGRSATWAVSGMPRRKNPTPVARSGVKLHET